MGKVIVNRISSAFGGLVSYNVYIDNLIVGFVRSGDIKEFDVENGEHIVLLKVDSLFGVSSNILKINVSEEKVINIFCKSEFMGININYIETEKK